MNSSKRLAILLLVAAIALFLGMVFWPFIFDNIIRPTAVVVWILLRVLVLSIHQKYFWYAVVVAGFIVLFRILPKGHSETQPDSYRETNTTILNISYWRVLFTYSGQDIQEDRSIKRELTPLLTSLYASKQRTSNDFRIHEALEQGTIPLPQNNKSVFPIRSKAATKIATPVDRAGRSRALQNDR
jgi:uncharacterized membrane protein YccC